MSQDEQTQFNPWEAAQKAAEQRKQDAENAKNNSGFDFEEIQWVGMPVDKWTVFRILGVPFDFRTESWHPKMILRSEIVSDDKKSYSKINWKYICKNGKFVPDPEWILTKLYDKVMEHTWVKYTEADIDPVKKIGKNQEGKIVNAKGYNGYYVDKHTHTECYQIIKDNSKGAGDVKKAKFYPAARIIMNVISRENSWCADNKHSALLCTNVGIKEVVNDKTGEKTIIKFPQAGVSISFYDEIMTYIGSTFNHWNTDFAVKRYKAQDMYKNLIIDAKLPKDRLDASIREIMSDAPLTKEEQEYEKYDLDKLFQVSSYQKILKKHGGLFKLFDKEFNENLTEELVLLAEQEKKEMEASKESVKDEPDEIDTPEESAAKEPVQQETKGRQSREPLDIQAPQSNVIDFTKVFKFWNNLSKEDKEDILKFCVKLDEGMPIWAPNTNLIPCDKCKIDLPKTVMHCPNCDADYNS